LDLAAWVESQIIAGKTEAEIAADIYDQPAYKAAFPAMEDLRKKGQTITEAEYRATEQTYRDTLAYYGLAGSPYDTSATITQLMKSVVSPRELETRLDDARAVAQSTDPNVKRALVDYYNINENDLMMYALDPAGQGKDYIERLSRTAVLAGVAETARLGLSKTYAESLAMDTAFDNRTEADVRETVQNAAALSVNQSRLAQLEGDTFTGEDALDIVAKKDQSKALASRKRAEREQSRFSGSSSASSRTLGGSGI
jgi:hypothetical protein